MDQFSEEDVIVNHHDAAMQVHLSHDDDLSWVDNMIGTLQESTQRLVVRCSDMPAHVSALHRLQRLLLLPQFTDVTILLSNGVTQLPLDVFRTFFASTRSLQRLTLLVSGRSTSVDGLVALLACWKVVSHQGLHKLTVGCTWHHPRPASQWNRLNQALHKLEGQKIGTLTLEKVTLKELPSVHSLELSHCQTSSFGSTNKPMTSLVLEPLPQAVPGISQWLQTQKHLNRLGLDVYRLSPAVMGDLLSAVNGSTSTLAILGIRHSQHVDKLIEILPTLRVRHLELEYVDFPSLRPQWPTAAWVSALQANWHVLTVKLRRRTPDVSSPWSLLFNDQRQLLQRTLRRNESAQQWMSDPEVYIGTHMVHQCSDVTLTTQWLLMMM